jgi:hypothetical protein
MKKIILVLIFLQIAYFANSQDYRIGLRFSPLQSQYVADSYTRIQSVGGTTTHDEIDRVDSLGLTFFCDKYLSSKDFFLRAEFSFGKIAYENSYNNSFDQSSTKSQEEVNQWIYNLNLGIGTRTQINKFKFYFGSYIPISFLPNGEQIQKTENYYSGVLTGTSLGTGKLRPSFGIGIGAFAGITTSINNRVTLGVDLNYQFAYIYHKVDWHYENYSYGSNPASNITDEKRTYRNFYTSKITPSITIAYIFNSKSKKSLPSQ